MLVHGLVAALTLGLAPPTAHGGDEIDLELDWRAPLGCPERDEVRRSVARLVPDAEARLRVRAEIMARGSGFEGTLALEGDEPASARRLHADDCHVLARAMAVVIAVSLDPVAVVESTAAPTPTPTPTPPDPEPAVEPRQPPPIAAVAPRRTPPLERSSSRTRAAPAPPPHDAGLELGVRLGAGVGGFLLPAAGVGLSLAPFLGTSRLHVRAVAQYWAPQRIVFDPQRDASAEVQLVSGGVRVCPQLAWARVRVPLCGGADVGAMLGRGTGRDLVTSSSGRQTWVGAVLEPGLAVGVSARISLWLALEGVISLYRPRFAIDGGPAPWTAGSGALRGLVGVQLHASRTRSRKP